MRHPSEFYVKFLLVRDPGISEQQINQDLGTLSFGQISLPYLVSLRTELANTIPPSAFNPRDANDRTSVRYLKDLGIYEMFHPTPAMEEAWENLRDPTRRMMVEQLILSHHGPAKLDYKETAKKINKKYGWFLTEAGLQTHEHYFWNAKLLTFDQWAGYLGNQSQTSNRYLSIMQAPAQLAFYHLRLEQALESKRMIKHAQEIAYGTLLEVSNDPKTQGKEKVWAISMLTKSLVQTHEALTSSDAALGDILKQFEKFRMTHPVAPAPSIHQLAERGDYSGSGKKEEKDE